MAIKVKHDMNAAPAAAAGMAAGRAQRSMETAKFFQQGKTQQLQGAHAGAAPIPQAHAPTVQASAPLGFSERFERERQQAGIDAQKDLAESNNEAAMKRLETQHKNNMELAEHQTLLDTIRDANKAKLNMPPKMDMKPPPVVTGFPTAPVNGAGGSESPEIRNKVSKIPEVSRAFELMKDIGAERQFDNAMSIALNVLSGRRPTGAQPTLNNNGNSVETIFNSLIGRKNAGDASIASTSSDYISNVYQNGGYVFGNRGEAAYGRPLQFGGEPDGVVASGIDPIALKAYKSSLLGMENMFFNV